MQEHPGQDHRAGYPPHSLERIQDRQPSRKVSVYNHTLNLTPWESVRVSVPAKVFCDPQELQRLDKLYAAMLMGAYHPRGAHLLALI